MDLTSFVMGRASAGGGGGSTGSSWTRIYQGEISDSDYTGTSGASLLGADIELGSEAWRDDVVLWVKIRDKAGLRDGHFFGSDCVFINTAKSKGSSYTNVLGVAAYTGSDGACSGYGSSVGVYANKITNGGKLSFMHKYSASNSGTLEGTYAVEVYQLAYAPNGNPFA